MMKGIVDRFVMAAFDVLTFAGAVLGAWQLWVSLRADSAAEIGTGAVVALALVVIPYALSSMFHRLLERQRWRQEGI